MALPHAEQAVDGPAAHEPEVADVGGDGAVGKGIHQAVEQVRGGALGGRLALPLRAAGVDDVVAGLPEADELWNQLGGILEVGIDHDHRVAARVVEGGRHRDLLAEVARQADQGDAGVPVVQDTDGSGGPVRAAVIGEDDLPSQAGCVEGLAGAGVEGVEDRGLVVGWDDQAEAGVAHPMPLQRGEGDRAAVESIHHAPVLRGCDR